MKILEERILKDGLLIEDRILKVDSFLNYQRIRCFIKNLSFFAVILFTAFTALEMMSLVNPGIFAPFPYLMLATVYFAVMENCNSKDTEGLKRMMKGDKYESSDNRK